MKYFMDFHTHTIAGGHAYSTLQENIASAMEQGLKFRKFPEPGIGCTRNIWALKFPMTKKAVSRTPIGPAE